MKFEAILLLGPTGSGKTPLGDCLEQFPLWDRRCHHFDFGANLRAVVGGETAVSFTAAEIRFLRRVLEEGALLEAEHFPLAARILDAFIARKNVQTADLLVLNGLPRHREQAKAMVCKVAVIAVVQLDCDARTVAERLWRNSAVTGHSARTTRRYWWPASWRFTRNGPGHCWIIIAGRAFGF